MARYSAQRYILKKDIIMYTKIYSKQRQNIYLAIQNLKVLIDTESLHWSSNGQVSP